MRLVHNLCFMDYCWYRAGFVLAKTAPYPIATKNPSIYCHYHLEPGRQKKIILSKSFFSLWDCHPFTTGCCEINIASYTTNSFRKIYSNLDRLLGLSRVFSFSTIGGDESSPSIPSPSSFTACKDCITRLPSRGDDKSKLLLLDSPSCK